MSEAFVDWAGLLSYLKGMADAHRQAGRLHAAEQCEGYADLVSGHIRLDAEVTP